jgi:hypothetical protein
VLPAFLNRVLEALINLMKSGIDYSSTIDDLENIQCENSHLFRFAKDVSLTYSENSTITAGEIWKVLEQWYQENGTLAQVETAKGKKKAIWFDQANSRDRNVKAANQIIPHFLKIFPAAKLSSVVSGRNRLPPLSGLGFSTTPTTLSEPKTSQDDSSVANCVASVASDVANCIAKESLPDKASLVNVANFPSSEEKNKNVDSQDENNQTEPKSTSDFSDYESNLLSLTTLTTEALPDKDSWPTHCLRTDQATDEATDRMTKPDNPWNPWNPLKSVSTTDYGENHPTLINTSIPPCGVGGRTPVSAPEDSDLIEESELMKEDNINEFSEFLSRCTNAEELDAVRKLISDIQQRRRILNEAAKRLPKTTQNQIRVWIKELNQTEPKTPKFYDKI